MNRAVALLEVSSGHVEVLYAQALFLLRSGYDVSIIIADINVSRIEAFNLPITIYAIEAKKRAAKFRYIHRVIKQNAISTLIINTAHGSIIKFLPFRLFGVKVVGIIHGLEKVRSSITQKLLSLKIRRYFVLSRHLYEQCPQTRLLRCSYFYPIHFPTFTPLHIDKKEHFYIAIPGQLEFKRRNYTLLASAVTSALNKSIKFLLLGSHNHENGDGKAFEAILNKQGIRDYFIFFDTFVDDATFHSYLQASDAIMPLIYADSRYVDVAISGSYNLAFAHKKPLLMPNFFSQYSEFSTLSLFYEDNHLEDFLNALPHQKSLLADLSEQISNDERFTFETQRKRYMALIES